jgi:hypothetical protein
MTAALDQRRWFHDRAARTVGKKKIRSRDSTARASRHQAGTRQGHETHSGGELSRSALLVLWPFCEPAQFRQSAGELGSSVDRVHPRYLDSGAEM